MSCNNLKEKRYKHINSIFIVQLLFVGLFRMVFFESLSWTQTSFAIVDSLFPLLPCGTYHADFISSTAGICDKMWHFSEPFVIICRSWPASLFGITIFNCSNKLEDEVFPVRQVPESWSSDFLLQDERIYHTHLHQPKEIFLHLCLASIRTGGVIVVSTVYSTHVIRIIADYN